MEKDSSFPPEVDVGAGVIACQGAEGVGEGEEGAAVGAHIEGGIVGRGEGLSGDLDGVVAAIVENVSGGRGEVVIGGGGGSGALALALVVDVIVGGGFLALGF